MKTKRNFLAITLASSLSLGLSLAAQAADPGFPTKPVKLIVPYPPGGGSDTFARTVSPKLSDELGQQFIIDNRPGAATIIGADLVAKSPADGYTLLLGDNSTYAVNSSLYKKMPYDALKDFSPVTLTARFALVLVVNPAVQAQSVQDFIRLAKSQPGKLSYGSPGAGSPHHLAMELFAQRAGINLVHVPYKGGAPATQDLLGGTLPVMMLDFATASQHMKSGKLRALGTASDKRLPQFADVPTIAESGFPGYEAWAWQGIVAPTGTPPEVITRLNAALTKVAADPDVKKRMTDLGGDFVPSTPAAMQTYMRAETAKWARIIKDANISIE
ncbi:MAG: tripartite tricarboxylate transporter substrate binding protein [Pseudomonadota bacterium]